MDKKRTDGTHLTEMSKIIAARNEARLKEQLEERKQIAKEKNRTYYRRNIERAKAYLAQYRITHKSRNSAYHRKYVEELRDGYVRHLLCCGTILKAVDIPQELVEVKRQHILLGRFLKEKCNERNDERIESGIDNHEQEA